MSNEDLLFKATVAMHDLSVSDDGEKACMGRGAKLIYPVIEEFIRDERSRDTDVSDLVFALTKLTSLFGGTAITWGKHGMRKELVDIIISEIKKDLYRMAENIDAAEKRMAAGETQ